MPIDWDPVDVTPVRTPDGKTTIPQSVLDSIDKNKVGLKGLLHVNYEDRNAVMCYLNPGPLATQIGKGHVSLNLTLRR